jgi:hypothetical protein
MAELRRTTLTRVRTERHYAVVEGTEPVIGRMGGRLRIIPRELKLSLGTDGRVRDAVVTGPALLATGKVGSHTHSDGWMWWAEDQPGVPQWITDTMVRDGLQWATSSEGR